MFTNPIFEMAACYAKECDIEFFKKKMKKLEYKYIEIMFFNRKMLKKQWYNLRKALILEYGCLILEYTFALLFLLKCYQHIRKCL